MALPTLMGLPTECRLQIYSYIFQEEMPEIVLHLDVKYHEGFWHGDRWHTTSRVSSGGTLVRTTIHHPLLYVSRQTRAEALDRYQIKLIINELRSPREYAEMKYWLELFSEEVRQAITHIEIRTVPVIDHLIINKQNFPNLQRFTTSVRPSFRPRHEHVYRRFTTLVDLEAAITIDGIRRFIVEQKRRVEDNNLYNHPFISNELYKWTDDEAKEDLGQEPEANTGDAEVSIERDWELYLQTIFILSCNGPEVRRLEVLTHTPHVMRLS